MTTPENKPTRPAEPATLEYKQTLNLPRTNFEMKANLTQREPAILGRWETAHEYESLRQRHHPLGKWVLHDGPPYANGDIHTGHLINKVLKDMIVRFRNMQGWDSPYVPGWDCHGLPIESAVQKELGPKMRTLSPAEIRQHCRDYALKFVRIQSASFQRLGIQGDFKHPYLTLDPRYEAGVVGVLAELVHNNLVYRQRKPVHWCTADQTALAEAELEYAPKKDTSVYVRFPLCVTAETWPAAWGPMPAAANLLIWTTTPWTLPANRAVAAGPKHEYVCVRQAGGEEPPLILAAALAESVLRRAGITAGQMSAPVTGAAWIAMQPCYRHPLQSTRTAPVVLADYVTLEDGTGLVHTAPGHGLEDYQTGRRENLEIYCPVRANGSYDDSVPEFLRGQTIWHANPMVVEFLKANHLLFHQAEIDHSYPHCWRCHKPTIFRATEQWFVRASGSSPLMQTARRFVEDVTWIPTWGKNRIVGMLESRPDWCISRQRWWGVPIPAFFDQRGNILLSEKSLRHIASYFGTHGADSWYQHSPQQILGGDTWIDSAITPEGEVLTDFTFKTAELRQGADILDVWFESGASHRAVLEATHPELGYPAALYLEGSDQHRGWFQASLLEAAGYRQKPPFQQVLTHGFIVDAQGRKMSKSQGNDIKVVDALKENGADVLRLWVCSVDYQHDMPCSKELFARTGEAYRKLRNTIRYLLGNLFDFDITRDAVDPQRHSIDAWMQHRLSALQSQVKQAYEQYEFHHVFKLLYEFCNVDISSIYAKAIKDRLYCELPGAVRRRASQTMCHRLLTTLVELLAPVLVFTADEAWQAVLELPGMKEFAGDTNIHQRIFFAPPAPPAPELAQHWETLMPLIHDGLKQLDDLKRSIGLGNALDAQALIVFPATDALARFMADYGPEIEDALGLGFHRIQAGEQWSITITDTRGQYASCARCWKRRPDVGQNPAYPDLSARDADVVQKLAAAK